MLNLLLVVAAPKVGGEDAADGLAERLAAGGRDFPGVLDSSAGKTLPRALNGGALMWRLAFASEDDHWSAVTSSRWQDEVAGMLHSQQAAVLDRIVYRSTLSDVSKRRAGRGIWRCLVLSVDAGTPDATIRQFERDTALMPDHVSTIRNWSLGHVVARQGRRHWTHVWEQEFDGLAGLEGEYMLHPIHWGLVDGWFDPECPQRIVDPFLIHAAFDIEASAIV